MGASQIDTSSARVGHNNPPSPLDSATATINQLGWFLQSNPAIDHTNATEAAKLIEAARKVAQDLEAERDGKVRPLNEQVAEINAEYKAVHNSSSGKPGTLDRLVVQIKDRLAAFARKEEQRRAAEAEHARQLAREAEAAARAAEEAERQAAIDMAFGTEPATPIATATVAADQAFSAYTKAERQAAVAERDVPVRLATGIGRAVSLRSKETLHVDDWTAAIKEIGLTDGIKDAILSSARAYRKLHDKLPAGIRAETERGM